MKRIWLLALLLAAIFLPRAAPAQLAPVPPLDISRAHVTANSGFMALTTGQNWSGASVGGTVLYNFHPKLSAFVGYDHGFPVNNVDPQLNLVRAVGSLRVHPNGFVGFGYAWFDKHTDGALAQLLIYKPVMRRLDLSGVYAHIFSSGDTQDFEYVRVFVNYHLLGKE